MTEIIYFLLRGNFPAFCLITGFQSLIFHSHMHATPTNIKSNYVFYLQYVFKNKPLQKRLKLKWNYIKTLANTQVCRYKLICLIPENFDLHIEYENLVYNLYVYVSILRRDVGNESLINSPRVWFRPLQSQGTTGKPSGVGFLAPLELISYLW